MSQSNPEFYESHPIEFIEKFIRVNRKPMKLNNNQKNLIKNLIKNS